MKYKIIQNYHSEIPNKMASVLLPRINYQAIQQKPAHNTISTFV